MDYCLYSKYILITKRFLLHKACAFMSLVSTKDYHIYISYTNMLIYQGVIVFFSSRFERMNHNYIKEYIFKYNDNLENHTFNLIIIK